MKIYLIRHGETTGDIEDRYGGEYNDHLTERGREQSEEAAKKMVNKGVKIIFASPYFRAQETAKIIQGHLNCPLETIDDLRERSYGIISGLTKADAKDKYPDIVELQKNSYLNDLPGGETYDNFKVRIASAMKKLIGTPHSTIIIITHGGPIRCIFREILKKGELENLGDCEVFEIDTKKEGVI
jgi:broad specificity phosphatase PhoE